MSLGTSEVVFDVNISDIEISGACFGTCSDMVAVMCRPQQILFLCVNAPENFSSDFVTNVR